MPAPSLRVLGAGLAEALAGIHRAGLIHRDIKPSNILLALDGPRVIDFGISRAIDGTVLTADGNVFGSPGYMSPEHSSSADLAPASDVFSMGAVLAFAATGRSPFGDGPSHAVLHRVTHEQPRLDGIPPELAGIVAACLDKNSAARPTVEQLQAWLRPAAVTGWLGAVEDQVVEFEQTVAEEMRGRRLRRRSVIAGRSGSRTAAQEPQWRAVAASQFEPELEQATRTNAGLEHPPAAGRQVRGRHRRRDRVLPGPGRNRESRGEGRQDSVAGHERPGSTVHAGERLRLYGAG